MSFDSRNAAQDGYYTTKLKWWGIVGFWVLGCFLGGAFCYAYEEIPVTNGGHIVGNIRFAGMIPSPRQLEISKDQEVCGRTEKFDRSLVVGESKGLQNVLVSLRDISVGKEFSAKKSILDQRDCVYDPRIVVVPVGQPLSIMNNDGVLHSLHTHSVRNPAFNKAQPKFKKEIVQIFSFPEVIKLTCDVHSWMSGWIVVSQHPYYAVSGVEGYFTLANVPEGNYELLFWHEKLGEKKQDVIVEAGKVTDMQLWFEEL